MRVLHTSDWHLGHTLRDVTREYEHARFLAWLVETCAREEPDVVLITGDVFDSATPPASAERAWFELLAAIARGGREIVVIAGNHDSPGRLGAAASVLRELNVHVVGALPANLDDVLVPVAGGRGLVAAVPFLRPVDVEHAADPLARVYADIAAKRDERAFLVMGHLYVAGSAPSPSERRVTIGGVEAASPRLLPKEADYVALGHLHRPQSVLRHTIRYAGSPIPLSFDEAGYEQSVVVVDFDGNRAVDVRTLRIPRFVELERVTGPVGDVLAVLDALPVVAGSELVDPERPLLEVVVRIDKPEPRLRALVEMALDGKRPRLVRLGVETTGDGAALAERTDARRLAELDPRDVFLQCWARTHADPPSEAVTAGFSSLLDEVGRLS